ncbi:hypothetical protein Tco_1104112 [Tanacetum coccineum]
MPDVSPLVLDMVVGVHLNMVKCFKASYLAHRKMPQACFFFVSAYFGQFHRPVSFSILTRIAVAAKIAGILASSNDDTLAYSSSPPHDSRNMVGLGPAESDHSRKAFRIQKHVARRLMAYSTEKVQKDVSVIVTKTGRHGLQFSTSMKDLCLDVSEWKRKRQIQRRRVCTLQDESDQKVSVADARIANVHNELRASLQEMKRFAVH